MLYGEAVSSSGTYSASGQGSESRIFLLTKSQAEKSGRLFAFVAFMHSQAKVQFQVSYYLSRLDYGDERGISSQCACF